MLRRLLAQLGLTTLVMALGAGAVFADTAPAATPPASDPGQTVVSADTSSITIDTSHTSTTSVGTSGGGSIGGDNSGSGTPPAATPPSSNSPTDNLKPDNSSNAKASNSSTNASTTSSGPTVTPGQTGGSQTPPIATTAASSNSLVASLQRVAYISGLTPIAPIMATPVASSGGNHAPPSSPPAPVGFLYQLHVLLISTLVPAVRFVPDVVKAAAASQAGLAAAIVLVLSCLALLELTVPANSYAARLRRSGFLGAARSDVAPLLLFATPREMSSIGAGAPG